MTAPRTPSLKILANIVQTAWERLEQLRSSREESARGHNGRSGGETTSSGTGFFVSRAGHILTNRHVVEGCQTLRTGDGVSLNLVAASPEADLALLTANIEPRAIAAFRLTEVRLGEPVVAFGFPLRGMLAASGNIAAGIISGMTGLRNNPRSIQISVPVQPGNSGGPLLDQSGNVVGVAVSKLNAMKVAEITGDIPQNVNFAVRGSEAIQFLRAARVPFQTALSQKDLRTADIATAAQASSVLILCNGS